MGIQMKTSLDAIFKPRSIALVGASNNITTWGYGTLNSLLAGRFRHTIYPVNPKEKVIQGIPGYPNISAIPGEVDLAIIVVNASLVPSIIEECIAKKIKGGIVITAGFAESSADGGAKQKEIAEKAKAAGFYFLGPNCLGVWSSEGNVNTLFRGNYRPHRGPISFISQSGTLGQYLYDASQTHGFGVNKFVSIGNQASITFIDLLEYLGNDDNTKVITAYVEDVGDGGRFLDVARAVTAKKPLLIYKAGSSEASARAARSHTAAMAGNDAIFDAVCRQAGAIRWTDFMEMFYIANALCYQPLPQGNRVAILSNGGGFCVTAAEACARLGLSVPELSAETQDRIRDEMFPFSPPPVNPIDCIGIKSIESFINTIEICAKQDDIDGLIVMQPNWMQFNRHASSTEMINNIKLTEAIATIPERLKKPMIISSFDFARPELISEMFMRHHVPVFKSPVDCAKALLGLTKYSEIRRRGN
jgi:acyl-CoA synthetase (NDP forming)